MNEITTIIITGFVFLIFLALFIRASYKYMEDQSDNQLGNAAILLLFVIPSCSFFIASIQEWTEAPVISSCEMIITEQGDTLYEFQDATRYCCVYIEETDTSTVFVTRKEDVSLGLSRGDSCLNCHRPLREHSRSQTIYSPEETLDGWDGVFFPY